MGDGGASVMEWRRLGCVKRKAKVVNHMLFYGSNRYSKGGLGILGRNAWGKTQTKVNGE